MQDFFRGRRLRQTPQMRDFFRETPPVLVEDLIMPYFVVETEDQSLEKEIGTMPGQYDLSLTKLEEHVAKAVGNGLRNVILFGIPGSKDEKASGAYAEDIPGYHQSFVMGRRAMVCCQADTSLCGITVTGVKINEMKKDDWYKVKGKLKTVDLQGGGKTVVLYADAINCYTAPQDPYVYFS